MYIMISFNNATDILIQS